MHAYLMLHVAAGTSAIVAGAGAASVVKGSSLHRKFGQIFALSMFVMAILGIYLAIAVPATTKTAAPPKASVSIATLTFYLVASAWISVKRKPGAVGVPEYAALACALGIAAGLLFFGISAYRIAASPGAYGPYFVFAGFALGTASSDLRLILRGGLTGAARSIRHLWRMCFAWFFATAFFFLGQQKAMPQWLRGSPWLVLLAFVPLAIMMFWLGRIWVTRAAHHRAPTSWVGRVLGRVAFKARQGPCRA
jgi:hypothetical protein